MAKLTLIIIFITLVVLGYYWVNYKVLPPPSLKVTVVGLGVVEVGDLVEHSKFGTGLIKSIRLLEQSDDYIFTVKFDLVGEKNLIASAANLKLVKKEVQSKS